MASRQVRLGMRIVDAVNRFVDWLSDRLFGKAPIKRKVEERFGKKALPQADVAIRNYDRTKDRGKRYGELDPKDVFKPRPTKDEPTKPTIYRFHVKFKFKNPKTGETEVRGYQIDLPPGMTKRQIQDKIREQLAIILSKYEETGPENRQQINKRIGRVSVVRIEIL